MSATNYVEVSYSNNIATLPIDIKDKLLQPFIKYQYGNYQHVSSGLGLFICQQLMTKNSGSIEYEIEENRICVKIKFLNDKKV